MTHKHAYHEPACVEISSTVCLSPFTNQAGDDPAGFILGHDRMGIPDWEVVRWNLGIPAGWTLRPTHHLAGYWTLTATAGRHEWTTGLHCGHRSMQVTATALPLAVARLAARLRFHQRDCG